MKLAIKIMSLIFLGIIALLAADGYIAVRREIHLLKPGRGYIKLNMG
ncbi:MAG: hypothetical protein P8012_09185 [Desulfobacterales bacterium]